MKRATSAGRWSKVLTVAPLLAGVCLAQSPTFSLQVLSTSSGEQGGFVYGINNVGQAVGVAGGSVCPSGCAVVWRDGAATVLGAVNGVFGYESLGINNLSQVVGTAEMSDSPHTFQAIIWNNGTPTVLPSPGSQYVSAFAVSINDAGLVVGSAEEAGGTNIVPVAWNGSIPTVLGFAPGYTSANANGVNGSGLVVGTMCCAKAQEPEAVVWHGTTPTLLATAQSSPYPAGKALAANNLGLVVGTATNSVGGTHAAAWANGAVTDLGTLATGYFSSATAVNDRGVIVGESATLDNGEIHAALWGRVGAAPQDLNKLISAVRAAEFLLSGATGINNNCSIVVNGYNRKTGVAEAFLLTLIDSSNCVNGL